MHKNSTKWSNLEYEDGNAHIHRVENCPSLTVVVVSYIYSKLYNFVVFVCHYLEELSPDIKL